MTSYSNIFYWALIKTVVLAFVFSNVIKGAHFEIAIITGILLFLAIVLKTTTDKEIGFVKKIFKPIYVPMLIALILNLSKTIRMMLIALAVVAIGLTVWSIYGFLVKKISKVVVPSIWGGMKKVGSDLI
jgi:peptidoglycan/LPS O-acetylase OafA/YrhL